MDVVNRLLGMGVDPNHELTRMRPNGNGRGRFADYMMRGGTGPLMIAAMTYDDVAIKALLAHGAEVDVPNVFQITPLMAAAGMSGSSRGGVGSAITAAAATADGHPGARDQDHGPVCWMPAQTSTPASSTAIPTPPNDCLRPGP